MRVERRVALEAIRKAAEAEPEDDAGCHACRGQDPECPICNAGETEEE